MASCWNLKTLVVDILAGQRVMQIDRNSVKTTKAGLGVWEQLRRAGNFFFTAADADAAYRSVLVAFGAEVDCTVV